jgi:hypothetical protein
MKKANSVRAFVLTVVEIEDVLASLRDAKGLRDLTGQQRQQLEEAINALVLARDSELNGETQVPAEALPVVLRCVAVTQQWLRLLLAEFGVADDN